MGRRRLIDEAVLSSPDLMPLPASGRLLWVGLLIIADLDGYVRNDLRYIRNRIFPQTKTRITWLAKCLEYFEARGMIEIRPDRGPKRGRVGVELGTSGGRVGYEWGSSGGRVGVELGTSGGRVGAELGASAVVSYVYIKNWRKFQRHKGAGDEMSRDEMRGGDAKAPPPAPPKKPPAKEEEARGEDPALVFFHERLACPPSRFGDARRSILRHSYTPDDLRDWGEALDATQAILAGPAGPLRDKLPGDPVAWLRSRMFANKNPRTAGISWWRPEARVCPERGPAMERLREMVGQEIEYAGKAWRVEPQGLSGDSGILPWGDFETRALKRLVAQ